MKWLSKLRELDIAGWMGIITILGVIAIVVVAILGPPPEKGLLESLAEGIGKLAGEVVEGFEKARGK